MCPFQLNWMTCGVVMKLFKLKILRLHTREVYVIKENHCCLLTLSKTLNIGMHLDVEEMIWCRLGSWQILLNFLYFGTSLQCLAFVQDHRGFRKQKFLWQLSCKVLDEFWYAVAFIGRLKLVLILSCPINTQGRGPNFGDFLNLDENKTLTVVFFQTQLGYTFLDQFEWPCPFHKVTGFSESWNLCNRCVIKLAWCSPNIHNGWLFEGEMQRNPVSMAKFVLPSALHVFVGGIAACK